MAVLPLQHHGAEKDQQFFSDGMTEALITGLAKIEGLQAGCVEALMLNHNGEVAECTGDNFFLVTNNEVLTRTS